MKKLTFTYGKTEYTLEFTRKTVEEMERAGFDREELAKRPMILLPQLFAGAFKANHRKTSRAVIDEIFDNISDKSDLIGKLVEMYIEPFEAMMSDNEDDVKNIKWTTTW